MNESMAEPDQDHQTIDAQRFDAGRRVGDQIEIDDRRKIARLMRW
jgi:hypothetical protein